MTVHVGRGDAGGKGFPHLPGSTELRSGGPGVVGGGRLTGLAASSVRDP